MSKVTEGIGKGMLVPVSDTLSSCANEGYAVDKLTQADDTGRSDLPHQNKKRQAGDITGGPPEKRIMLGGLSKSSQRDVKAETMDTCTMCSQFLDDEIKADVHASCLIRHVPQDNAGLASNGSLLPQPTSIPIQDQHQSSTLLRKSYAKIEGSCQTSTQCLQQPSATGKTVNIALPQRPDSHSHISGTTRAFGKTEILNVYRFLSIPGMTPVTLFPFLPPDPNLLRFTAPLCTLRYTVSKSVPIDALLNALILRWPHGCAVAQQSLHKKHDASFVDSTGQPTRAFIRVASTDGELRLYICFNHPALAATASLMSQWRSIPLKFTNQEGERKIYLRLEELNTFNIKLSPHCSDKHSHITLLLDHEYQTAIACLIRDHPYIRFLGAWRSYKQYNPGNVLEQDEAWVMVQQERPGRLPGYYTSSGECREGNTANVLRLDYPLRERWCKQCFTEVHKRGDICPKTRCYRCQRLGHIRATCTYSPRRFNKWFDDSSYQDEESASEGYNSADEDYGDFIQCNKCGCRVYAYKLYDGFEHRCQ